jgi:uroporphyrin-III C-methyltransferase
MATKQFYLVGAGPGDPELISLKAIKILQNADVVLYDALVHVDTLKHAIKAEKIYVGKRSGEHYASQNEINHLIVEKLNQYSKVIRLKGGDPFIFGRAQEEIDYVRDNFKEIDIQVIPGISSAIGIPSLHQIPLTKRAENESIWIVTGTTAKCKISDDIYIAAQTSATVIILMGMNQLKNIVSIFKEYRGENAAINIIQNGSLENEKTVAGTLKNIEELVEQFQIKSPAIIIIRN